MGGNMCGNSLVLSIFVIINRMLLIAKIAIPLIIIVLTSIDIVKDITGSDANYKTSLGKVKYRLIAAILVFFIPNIISLGFSVVDTDYSKNNLECLLHVTNKDVDSARVAEADEIITMIENEQKISGIIDTTKIDEVYLLINKINDESLKEFYTDKIDNIKTLNDNAIEEKDEEQRQIAREKMEEYAAMMAQKGFDVDTGESKSGIPLLDHKKPYTGAQIKYYTQSSKGVYGAVNYTYKNKNYTYNASGCGCGYMSLSMIIDSLTGSNLTPLGIVQNFPPQDFAEADNQSKGYVDRCAILDGTIKSQKISNDYGLEVKELFHHGRGRGVQSSETKQNDFKMIKDALKEGYSLIVLIPGHYVVFGAIDSDEYISFYDPSNASNNGWFTIDTIYNNHYNHANKCRVKKTCGFIYAVAFKGKYPYTISNINEYNRKNGNVYNVDKENGPTILEQ